MILKEIASWFNSCLAAASFERSDRALNGVQVGRLDKIVRKAAFAVDASIQSFEAARQIGADLLVVHHGIFWGEVLPVVGGHFDRLKFLLANDLALCAFHLPLDAHPEVGNNASLARALGLSALEPFGLYHGVKIGLKGILSEEKTLPEVARLLFDDAETPMLDFPFGKQKVRSVGIVSGGASKEALQAIEEGLDLYVTGETSHDIYHYCMEGRLNVIFGGHYQTETWGVRALARKVRNELGIETVFLDLPTGL